MDFQLDQDRSESQTCVQRVLHQFPDQVPVGELRTPPWLQPCPRPTDSGNHHLTGRTVIPTRPRVRFGYRREGGQCIPCLAGRHSSGTEPTAPEQNLHMCAPRSGSLRLYWNAIRL